MGVQNSEVGYTPAMPRREDREVHTQKFCPFVFSPVRTMMFTSNGIAVI